MPTKEDKIDKLARMVAKGFNEVKGDINEVKGDISDIRSKMATKEDLTSLRNDIDIMLSHHIGTFRKDYDELSARVKKLEEAIFRR